ncbi:MAG: MerR family transcriptional regulator, partial [Candidatus Levybacteria bacterium]|nr:MerR family transcriptional regulator [Candidatus Levybacteria bacterium]
MNKLFSIQEVANILGVSTKTLRRWEEKGILVPHRTPGNQRRYTQEHIDNFKRQRNGETILQDERVIPASQLFPQTFPSESQRKYQGIQPQHAGHPSFLLEEVVKSIVIFKKVALGALFVTLFLAVTALTLATLRSSDSLSKVLSLVGIKSEKENNLSSIEATQSIGRAVLGADISGSNLVFNVGIPTEFEQHVSFLDTIRVAGIATLSGGIITENADIDAGTGRLTASNVVYGLIAGDGIEIGPGQTPTVTNTGVLSLAGETGEVELTAGSGISISGLTISSNVSTFKTIDVDSTTFSASSVTDILKFSAGNGITLTADTSNKKITIAGSVAGYMQRNNGAVSPLFITDDLLIGGISTTAANFAVLNIASGTPVASLSATPATANGTGLVLSSNGSIQSINKNTLTIGGGGTGNVALSGFGTGVMQSNSSGVLSSAPVNLASSTYVTGILSLENGGTANDLSGYTGNSWGIVYMDATTDNLKVTGGTSTTDLCLVSNAGNGTPPSWRECVSPPVGWAVDTGAGVVYTQYPSLDLLMGDAATTTSAKFAVLNIAGSLIPVASLSATPTTANGTGIYLSGNGSIQSINNQTLTIGGNSTGNIVLSPNNNAAGGNITLGDQDTTLTLGGLQYIWPTSQTSNFFLKTDGSGNLTWSDIGSAATNYWILQNGILSPGNATNPSVDFTLGGSSTASAKFAVLNMLTGTPYASVSAVGSNTGIYIGGDGTLQSVNKQTLTLGGATTGNISFSPGNSANTLYLLTGGKVGIGTTNPLATLDVRGASGTLPIASISGNTSFAGLVIDNSIGDIFTASASGATRLTLSNQGNLNLSGGVYQSEGTSGISVGSASCVITVGGIVTGSGPCAIGDTTNWWQVTSGALYPINNTVDLLIGGSSTLSAKFAVLNMNSGTPTASIAGNFSLGAGGSIQSTAQRTLTIGGDSTGDISFKPGNVTNNSTTPTLHLKSGGNVGIGTTNPTSPLQVSGNAPDSSLGSSVLVNGNLTSTSNDQTGLNVSSVVSPGGVSSQTYTAGYFKTTENTSNDLTSATFRGLSALVDYDAVGQTLGTAQGLYIFNPTGTNGTINNNYGIFLEQLARGGTSNYGIFLDNSSAGPTLTGNLGIYSQTANRNVLVGRTTIGSDSLPTAVLDVQGGNWGGNAALIVNQTGAAANDILAASASGATRFRVTNTGELVFADNNSSFFGTLDLAALTGSQTYTFPNATGTVCISTNNCSFALGTNYWTTSTDGKALTPINNTMDILIGGTTTQSAKFAVLNVAASTPTASISASSGNNAAFLTGAGTLATTNRQTLTLGGGDTGDINISIDASNELRINGTVGLDVSGTAQCVTTTNGIVTGTGVCQLGTEQWVAENGTLHPGILSQDLLIGGDTTASAKFAVLNMAGGTPTATLSGTTGGAYLTSQGTLQTTNKQSLT